MGTSMAIGMLKGVDLDIYDRIPEDTEILLTHTPPYGKLDVTSKDKHAGCHALARRLGSLARCKLHVFGWVIGSL